MKLGTSTYSLKKAIAAGDFDLLGAFDWVAANGGEHLEIVPLKEVFSLTDTPELINQMVARAKSAGVDISCYTFGASFINCDAAGFDAEITRVQQQVDIANQLGCRFVRHDVAFRPDGQNSDEQFAEDLPHLARACRQIADYAAPLGITTMVENHGVHVQGADRVLRLYHAVDRPNFKLLVDTGNFFPVEFEQTAEAVKRCAPFAGIVHAKDHMVRTSAPDPVENWRDRGRGIWSRPAIAGEGDIRLDEALASVKATGFDGYYSLEYEGHEEAQYANRQGLANLRQMLAGA